MSDYLWDKTGKPDAEVEELENLLGALKYQPRPLKIPATANVPGGARSAAATTAAATTATTMTATMTTIFSRPRLAIAASLILMLLAGTWLATRRNGQQTNHVAEVRRGNVTSGNRQPGDDVVTKNGTGEHTTVNALVAPKPMKNGADIIKMTIPKRSSQQFGARRRKQQQPWRPRVNNDVALPQREEIADTSQAEGREATEKVMLALRLASAKLNFAQRELQEISRANK